jgi:hypothetical protein
MRLKFYGMAFSLSTKYMGRVLCQKLTHTELRSLWHFMEPTASHHEWRSLSLVPILSNMNLVHTLTTFLSLITTLLL